MQFFHPSQTAKVLQQPVIVCISLAVLVEKRYQTPQLPARGARIAAHTGRWKINILFNLKVPF